MKQTVEEVNMNGRLVLSSLYRPVAHGIEIQTIIFDEHLFNLIIKKENNEHSGISNKN